MPHRNEPGARIIRRIVFLILGLVGAAVLAVVIGLVVLVRTDLRPRIESIVTGRLGRQLAIETLAIGWGNPLKLDLTGLHLANPAWGSTKDMVSVGRLSAEIALWPLLHGAVELSHVVVDRPVVVLERDTDGTGNWVFPGMGKHPAGDKPAPPPVRFVSDMQLQNGDLTFRTTEHHLLKVHAAQATLQAANDNAPVILHAEGSYNDLPLTADVTLESFAALRRVPQPVATDLAVAAKSTSIRFKGTMTDPVGFDGIKGALDLEAATTADLADILGQPVAEDLKLALKGMLDKQGDHWRLTEVTGTFADTTVEGSLGLDEGKRGHPDHFDINLDLGTLDLQRFADKASDTTPGAGQNGISLHVDKDPGSTFAVRLGVKQATYARYKFDTLRVEATAEPAKISLNKLSFGFADGRIDLSGTNEAAGTGGHLVMDARVSQMNAARLIAMAGADSGTLAGRVDAGATLDMTGTTFQEGLGSSRGQAIMFMNGGLISRQVLQLASLDLRLLLRKGQGSTAVVCFLSAADMRNGVVSVAPLRLKTREGNIYGGGQVDLRRNTMDLYLQSEGKSTHFWALDIPVHIAGSFANPKIDPVILSRVPDQNARGDANLRALPTSLRQTFGGKAC